MKPETLPLAAQETPRPPQIPLWLIALLTFSGTLAMHIFVPALPIAGADLGASAGAIQATISIYIIGLAIGQLVYGPVSDRFGRRPTLMVGLVLYVAASLMALFAPDVRTLIVARLFQALGGCTGLVLGRAIVRDTAGGSETAKRLALLNLMVAVGPGTAPLVGGVLANSISWRAIFLLLSLLGLLNFVLTWRLLPETRVKSGETGVSLLPSYARLLRSPAFLGFAIGGGCATTSLYAFVAAAPFIFVHELGRSTHEVGPYMAILVFGVAIGSILATRLIGRVRIRSLLIVANAGSVAAAFLFLAAVLSGHLTVPITLLSMALFTIGAGTASPAALTEAISTDPSVIGSASGLYGFAQMAIGALCTALVGIGSSPSFAAAVVVAGAGLIAQASFWIALRTAPRR